jgi:hypothetical protein
MRHLEQEPHLHADPLHTERMKFRPFRNFMREGKPEGRRPVRP